MDIDTDERIDAIINYFADISNITEIDSDLFAEWNIIPYGSPSVCKQNLLIVLDGKYNIESLFERALEHLDLLCKDITKLVLLYVNVGQASWKQSWFNYEARFATHEDNGIDIHIHFG